jgi:phosphoribosyl-ATP pyrophosphohydrolase/phosphoribosyl-AMP cyclohydrolase
MKINWEKHKLIPAVIQNSENLKVLMVGYMNKEAYEKTISEKYVTFFSRSKNRLWTKGETSSNYLELVWIDYDCDGDAILVNAKPLGPTCHLGNESCFNNQQSENTVTSLEKLIDKRKEKNNEASYISTLLKSGNKEITKKLIEEAGETAISALSEDGRLIDEASDLLFHLLVLLKHNNKSLNDVFFELNNRKKANP